MQKLRRRSSHVAGSDAEDAPDPRTHTCKYRYNIHRVRSINEKMSTSRKIAEWLIRLVVRIATFAHPMPSPPR
jgi:hypothetical protein